MYVRARLTLSGSPWPLKPLPRIVAGPPSGSSRYKDIYVPYLTDAFVAARSGSCVLGQSPAARPVAASVCRSAGQAASRGPRSVL